MPGKAFTMPHMPEAEVVCHLSIGDPLCPSYLGDLIRYDHDGEVFLRVRCGELVIDLEQLRQVCEIVEDKQDV